MNTTQHRPNAKAPSKTTTTKTTRNVTRKHETDDSNYSQNSKELITNERFWYYFKIMFGLFVIVRLITVPFNIIPDCDEVFNYWEPMHYIVYGKGLQTWEYSPAYALRAYLYIGIPGLAAKILSLIGVSKISIFFILRGFMGVLCAFCEALFCTSVSVKFEKTIGWITCTFLLLSPGMSLASISFVPSSFSMYFLMLAYVGWLLYSSNIISPTSCRNLAIFAAALGAILGWPFSALCAVPLAIFVLVNFKFIPSFIVAFGSVVIISIPIFIMDYFYYGQPIFTPLNLVLYNSRYSEGGSALYGVEPWTYYFKNSILNFNIAFGLAIGAPLIFAISLLTKYRRYAISSLSITSPFYIWFTFMTTIPHKEERFLFVIYPFVGLSAALCLNLLARARAAFVSKFTRDDAVMAAPLVIFTTLLLFGGASISRQMALYYNYGAPLKIYSELYNLPELENPSKEINVCVGKEWYRFPSSFFFPSDKINLSFLRSGFRGLLPAYFKDTTYIPPNMNNENREEMDRYVSKSQCDYIIDFDFKGQEEEHYVYDKENWKVITSHPFLNAPASTNPATRAFYLTDSVMKANNKYDMYYLLGRIHHHQ
eukprot:gb/GECH01009396.1/.p1 GENE.gb/GECH01009396.1/~~gb/GECH01009396.1/.p1  ORF type:complete len:596 (+),score=88.29 gb/GECH01009396.1/:1-1788(+)